MLCKYNENKTKVYFDKVILVAYDKNDVSERNPGSISNYEVGLDELYVDYFVLPLLPKITKMR